MTRIRRVLVPVAVVVLAMAIASPVAVALGVLAKLPTMFPDLGLSDAERQARVDVAHERGRRYLLDFVASGQDPRSLPRIYYATFAATPSTIDEVVSQAALVVRGTVIETTFAFSDDGLPTATSRVAVTVVIDGASTKEVVVEQRGGPVPQELGGALAALESDPIILPGDEVILLLRPGGGGVFRTAHGGVYLVERGQIRVIETTEESVLSAAVGDMEAVAFIQAVSAAVLRR